MAVKQKQYRLRMTDISDREVLALIDQEADEEGYTESVFIAEALWPRAMSNGNETAKRAAMGAVATRLSWMARLGVVVRAEGTGMARWALTGDGEELLAGKLTAGTQHAIERLSGAQTVLATQRIAERAVDDVYDALRRRAWRFGQAR